METDRAIGFLISDTHINSTVALGLPYVQLDAGGYYTAGDIQRWILKQYYAFLDRGREIKKGLGWPFFVIHHGETADDLVHRTTELVSKNPQDQLRHASQVLEPLAELADFFFVMRGTEAHVGPASWMDDKVAADLGAIPAPDGRHSWYKLRLVMGGVPTEHGHHPGTSSRREHTRGGDSNRLAADVVAEYARTNRGLREQGDDPLPIPSLIVRGHNHFPADSGPINQPARAIILPSWQLTTNFGHRLGGKVAPVGGTIVLFEKGRITNVEHFHRYLPIRRPWTIQEWMIDQNEVTNDTSMEH